MYLDEQIITYIGNKRKLLPYIEKEVQNIQAQIGKTKLVCADIFSGSGIVARLLKHYSSVIITNDMEDYSRIINDCYLTNKWDFDEEKFERYKVGLQDFYNHNQIEGIITKNYAPKDDNNIQAGERVFYTTRNAKFIDTAMYFIQNFIERDYQKFFIAPLLYEASVHVNTSGVFKGFYKNKDGTGQYGGTAENCLLRIKEDIKINKPVLSDDIAMHVSLQGDANRIVKALHGIDITYIDPPYNQHPYGSNYFMLNVIAKNSITAPISKVSGIPDNWNRSNYNKKDKALVTMDDLIKNLDSKFVIISYNNEGFIEKEEMENLLKQYGELKTVEIKYNTFRGSRNLCNRSKYVNEYLFVLKMR